MSKRLFLFFFSLILLSSYSYVRAEEVGDSTYCVYLSSSRLKNQIRKKEYPLVKTLILYGSSLWDEDVETLSKLTNLKKIVFANNDDFLFHSFQEKMGTMPSIEEVEVDDEPLFISESKGFLGIIEEISSKEDPFNKYHDLFPSLKKAYYKFTDDTQWTNDLAKDESRPIVCCVSYKNYGESTCRSVGFKVYPKDKIAEYSDEYTEDNCNVYVKLDGDTITNDELYHNIVMIKDASFAFNSTVIIPKELRLLVGKINIPEGTKFSIEEGNAPLCIDASFRRDYWEGDKIIDSLVVNRPLVWCWHYGDEAQAFNYVIFNKEVYELPQSLKTYMASFSQPLPSDSEFDITAQYVMVPKGCKESFVSHGFKNVYEKLDKYSYNIKESKPGTLLSYISPDSLFYVDSLTISGFLYDTECKLLKKCKNLSYLNLRNAIIIESPESERRDKENMEAFSAYLGMLSKSAGLSVVNGDASAADYLFTQGVVDLLKGATLPAKVANKIYSFLPGGVFAGIPLQTAILPRYCSSIGNSCFYGCDKLEYVEIPKNLKEIGNSAFYGCSNLKAITFPKCLESIDHSAFRGCNSLSVVDLSECHFCEVCLKMNAFWESGIKVLKLPYGVTRLNENFYALPKGMKIYFNKDYVGSSYLPAQLKNLEVFFQTTTPPDIYCVNCKVHVPKGSLTSYYSKLNRDDTWSCDNTFVEE